MIRLQDIWAMLDKCAPGHVRRKGKHHWIVAYQERTYRSLPLGPHGRRVDAALGEHQVGLTVGIIDSPSVKFGVGSRSGGSGAYPSLVSRADNPHGLGAAQSVDG